MEIVRSIVSIIGYDTIIYLALVGLLGPLIFWLIRRFIETTEQRRRMELKAQKEFSPLSDGTPARFNQRQARMNAIESTINRFSIIRRMFYFLLTLVWILALMAPFLGTMSATVLSLLSTAFAVLLGIAARPLIENVISGVVISFSRQINTGDTIFIDEQYGTIEDITLSHTIIKIWDWRRYIIPNSSFLRKEFINYSLENSDQWTYITFHVAPDADLVLAREVSLEITRNHELTNPVEEPSFWVMDMHTESIECWVAVWTKFYNAWTLRSELREQIFTELKHQGIKTHGYRFISGGSDPGGAIPPGMIRKKESS
jgi:small-conductance mechanosensitive channel